MLYARSLPSACVLSNDAHPGYVLIHPMPRLYIPAVREGDCILPLNAPYPGPVTYWFGSESDAWAFVEERMRNTGDAHDADA